MSESKTANELMKERNEAWEAMDEYFHKNYPFTDETFQEYERLSKHAVSAVEAFMLRCAPRWKQ